MRPLGRPGGMRWPPEGIIGGAKNSLFELGEYLMHVMALRYGDLAVASASGSRSSTPCSAQMTGAGGGLTSPRRITAARPPFFILRFEARPLGFIDIGDLKRLRCFLELRFEFFELSKHCLLYTSPSPRD